MAEENKNLAEETVETETVNQTESAASETSEKAAAETETSKTENVKTENVKTEETVQAEASTADEASAEETSDEEESKGRKFFGKKKDKKDKKDERIDELTDQVKRQMAEFDNYRKRTEKEKASMYMVGAKEVVEKILPVVDNFERGLATAKGSEDPFVLGMEKIYKQLMTTLADMGVTPMDAVGKEFDPNLHNAVMHVDDDTVGDNIVVEEFQKGYLYKDTVVRYSMVKVAN